MLKEGATRNARNCVVAFFASESAFLNGGYLSLGKTWWCLVGWFTVKDEIVSVTRPRIAQILKCESL